MGNAEQLLNSIREIQGTNGPNYCYASAKFLCGKLVGLFGQNKHLNNFFDSTWAKKQNRHNLEIAWGMLTGVGDFNNRVLKAAIEIDDAGVKAPNPVKQPVEFVSNGVGAAFGDQLLKQRVPLVVGVGLPGGYPNRDHFITLVADCANKIWAVDSWGQSTDASVIQLPEGTTLTKQTHKDMNAGATTIPCNSPWLGYYREKMSKQSLTVKIAF